MDINHEANSDLVRKGEVEEEVESSSVGSKQNTPKKIDLNNIISFCLCEFDTFRGEYVPCSHIYMAFGVPYGDESSDTIRAEVFGDIVASFSDSFVPTPNRPDVLGIPNGRMGDWLNWQERFRSQSGIPEFWFCKRCGRGLYVYRKRYKDDPPIGKIVCSCISSESRHYNQLRDARLPPNIARLFGVEFSA